MVRALAEREPALAQGALAGLRRFGEAEAPAPRVDRSVAARVLGASLLDCGGSGAPLILVPSPINPPDILDLDERCSLAAALRPAARVLLLDWGPAAERSELDLSAHVSELLLPLLETAGRARLVGYCLGGTMSLAAARLSERVAAVATLASPWHFGAYPEEARSRLHGLWEQSRPAAEQLGLLPVEVLQAAFWSLDPRRVVAKFADFAALAPESDEVRRFVLLEEWANGGEPLPLPAASELIQDLFGRDLTGNDQWLGGGLPRCPMLHVTARGDRIVPAASAPEGPAFAAPSGHVGMISGRRARQAVHAPLREWLEGLGADR